MGIASCKYEYLTEKARAILDNKRGYRDNTLFPKIEELDTDIRNPLDVVSTEILYCEKYEICDFFINHYDNEHLYTRRFSFVFAIKHDRKLIIETTAGLSWLLNILG